MMYVMEDLVELVEIADMSRVWLVRSIFYWTGPYFIGPVRFLLDRSARLTDWSQIFQGSGTRPVFQIERVKK